MKSLAFPGQQERSARGRSVVPSLVLALMVGATGAMSGACGKDPPKKPVDEPKKTTPVPSDMVLNDFVPATGGGGIVGVKSDGGSLEGGMGETAPTAAGDPAGGPAAGAEEPRLKVTEPGAEPRAARKYAFVANRSDKRLLTIRQSAAQKGGGPAQEGAFTLSVDFVPKIVKPAATKFEMKVLKIDVPDLPAAQKAQAAAQLAAFAGLTGSFDVTSRGEIGEVDFKADERMAGPSAEGIIQGLQQALELVVPPFPDAPIGTGAKWERSVDRKERGQENIARHTFTLTEVNAEGGVVSSEVEVSVPKRPFQSRGVPPGATEEVKGKGAYTYAFRFDHVATKVTGEMTIARRIEAPDGKGGKQVIAEMTIKLKNQLDSPGAAAKP